jgi:hypothetical protein
MGVASVGAAFDTLRSIRPMDGGIEIVPQNGRAVRVPVDTGFLYGLEGA